MGDYFSPELPVVFKITQSCEVIFGIDALMF
jgi:hypothetical protein